MKNTEIVKQLLKKALATQDEELIELANKLLEEPEAVEPVSKKTKKAPKKQVSSTKDSGDFTMKRKVDGKVKVPVNKIKNRKNIFFDDKTEAMSKADQTPKIKLSPRDRPKYKPTYKKCSNENCNNKIKVIAGDGSVTSYLCDSCILGRKGR
jgi:hypothetical protein